VPDEKERKREKEDEGSGRDIKNKREDKAENTKEKQGND
jgi:hypothetical protein